MKKVTEKEMVVKPFNPTKYSEYFDELFNGVTLKILRIWKSEIDGFNEFNIKIRIVGRG